MKIYGDKLVAHQGQNHTYLGMNLSFDKNGVFVVSMVLYIDTIIKDFPEAITSSAPTPCSRSEKLVRCVEEHEWWLKIISLHYDTNN